MRERDPARGQCPFLLVRVTAVSTEIQNITERDVPEIIEGLANVNAQPVAAGLPPPVIA